MFSLDRILLPIDFSERCLEAARHSVPPWRNTSVLKWLCCMS